MDVINRNNIKKILIDLNKYTNAIILGKGPTFKIPENVDEKTFVVCVNDTINFIDNCNLLVVNDIETWDRLDNNKISKLEYILTPLFPHQYGKPNPKKNNLELTKNKLKSKNFQGKLIIYNLLTSNKNKNYITLPSKITGSNNATDFLLNYLKKINEIHYYGIGIINKSKYNNIFDKTEGIKNYNNKYLLGIRNHIINSLKNSKIKYNLF